MHNNIRLYRAEHDNLYIPFSGSFLLGVLFMTFKLGVLIYYIFLTKGAYPSIYIAYVKKLGVLEHPKHP